MGAELSTIMSSRSSKSHLAWLWESREDVQGLDTPGTGTPALAVLVGELQGSPFWIEKSF